MYSEELLAPWLAVLRDRLPSLDVVDMHVHVGLSDPAGLLATEEEALASLALAGAHGVVFPLKEPGGYREANERMLDLARRRTDGSRHWPGWIRRTTRSARRSAVSRG